MESLSLIDILSENDLLIPDDDGPVDLLLSEDHEQRNGSFLLESASAREGEMAQAPPEEKINLRKSLAWDRAFFTSQGVLETEELGIVNSTFGKADGRKLPGIQEGLRKSSESTSTLDSETYALESLEVDLLDNLRASIQRSLGKCNKKASNRVSDAPRLVCKKADLVNKMKPPVNLKKDGLTMQQQQCASKKAVTGVEAAAKGSGQPKSLSRPPRIVPKPMSMVPSSKPSVGSKKISSGVGVGVNQRSVVASEKTYGNSCSATSRPNSSAIRTPGTAVFSTSSCSATSRPNSSAKRTPGSRPGTAVYSSSSSYSSPALGATRKGSALRNSGHLCGSTTKTPTPKSKPAPSTLGFSSKVSTHSSVDSVVSESSSTTSRRTKLSNSVESLSASSTSSRSMAVPSDVESSQAPGTCIRKQTSGTLSQSHHIAARAGPRALSEPSTRDLQSGITSSTGSRCSKPSGLRVPSPKIGYFDAEKTQVRSSNKISQTSIRNSLAKSTVGTSNNISGANKLKPTKTLPAAKRATMKFDSPKTHSTPKSPNHSMSPASPAPLFQQKEPAQPHSEDNHNIAEVADMVHPGSAASIHTKDGSAVLGEGHPEGTYKTTEATYQASKELKHEQSPLSLDFQDEHMQNIRTVAHKSEKENILPACEMNSVNQDFPTEGKSISAVLGKEHPVGTYRRTETIYQTSKVLKHEQLPCLLDGQDEHMQKLLPAYEMNGVTRQLPTEGTNHGPEAFLAFSF